MSQFMKMIEAVVAGQKPSTVIETEMGVDRKDDIQSPEQLASVFQQMCGEIQMDKPYVGPDWITKMADSIRTDPESIGDLTQMANQNRSMTAGTSEYPMWDQIHSALVAVRTNQLPPQN